MKLPIDKDPSYASFAARYADDVVAFAEEVLGLDLTPSQAEILRSAAVPGTRIGLTTHGESQDYLLPQVALHRLFFRPRAVTSVACPSEVLPEGDPYRRLVLTASTGPLGWVRPYLKLTGSSIRIVHSAGQSSVEFVPMRTGGPEEAVRPGPDHMWFIPDAGKIPARAFQYIAAGLTDRSQGVVCASPANPEFGNDTPIRLPLQEWFFCWPPREDVA